MPAQPRKKTAVKPTPAEAAAAEAVDGDVTVEFRGVAFDISGTVRRSARLAMASASGQDNVLLYELIGPAASSKFIDLCKPGESFADAAGEFFDLFAEASGQGNS